MAMSKQEMAEGFAYGLILVQEDWSTEQEVKDADELIAEGHATVITDWGYDEKFGTRKPGSKFRRIKGIKPEDRKQKEA